MTPPFLQLLCTIAIQSGKRLDGILVKIHNVALGDGVEVLGDVLKHGVSGIIVEGVGKTLQ